MFEKSFEARVEKVLTKRVKDEDGGAVHLSMHFCMANVDNKHLKELGGEIQALVDARNSSEGAKTVPFKNSTLDFIFKDVSLVVYELTASDKKPQVKFQIDDCEAKGLVLVRSKDDKTKVDLKWKVLVPPLKQRDQHFLIEATGENLNMALIYRQTSLNV